MPVSECRILQTMQLVVGFGVGSTSDLFSSIMLFYMVFNGCVAIHTLPELRIMSLTFEIHYIFGILEPHPLQLL